MTSIEYNLSDRIVRAALGLDSWGECPLPESQRTYSGPHPLANPQCRIAQAIRGDRDFDTRPLYVPLSDEELAKALRQNSRILG